MPSCPFAPSSHPCGTHKPQITTETEHHMRSGNINKGQGSWVHHRCMWFPHKAHKWSPSGHHIQPSPAPHRQQHRALTHAKGHHEEGTGTVEHWQLQCMETQNHYEEEIIHGHADTRTRKTLGNNHRKTQQGNTTNSLTHMYTCTERERERNANTQAHTHTHTHQDASTQLQLQKKNKRKKNRENPQATGTHLRFEGLALVARREEPPCIRADPDMASVQCWYLNTPACTKSVSSSLSVCVMLLLWWCCEYPTREGSSRSGDSDKPSSSVFPP